MKAYKFKIFDLEIVSSKFIKNKLISSFQEKFVNGNESDKNAFIRTFQIYQSRIFGLCFFRSKIDQKTWDNLFL